MDIPLTPLKFECKSCLYQVYKHNYYNNVIETKCKQTLFFREISIEIFQYFSDPGQSPMYTGAIDCVKKTLANEGPKGLYKGMATPLLGVVPTFAMCFFGNDFGKEQIRKFNGNSTQEELGVASLALAGGFSGILTTSIMTPVERIKCILQVHAHVSVPFRTCTCADIWDISLCRCGVVRKFKKYFPRPHHDTPLNVPKKNHKRFF